MTEIQTKHEQFLLCSAPGCKEQPPEVRESGKQQQEGKQEMHPALPPVAPAEGSQPRSWKYQELNAHGFIEARPNPN